jgi:hypothetical protein
MIKVEKNESINETHINNIINKIRKNLSLTNSSPSNNNIELESGIVDAQDNLWNTDIEEENYKIAEC